MSNSSLSFTFTFKPTVPVPVVRAANALAAALADNFPEIGVDPSLMKGKLGELEARINTAFAS